jgi:uncharacterized membrane protein
LIILFSTIYHAIGQENINPKYLELQVYPDGSVLLEYKLESEPSEVRVDIDLFGEKFNNLIIKDEDNFPLDYTENPTGITVDSIGASEITIIYYSYDLTTKDGPLWSLNISSPIPTKIHLPSNAAIFDLSDIPLDMGVSSGIQYVALSPGDLHVSYILSIPDLKGEVNTILENTDEYLAKLEEQGYILKTARDEYNEAQTLYQDNQYSEAEEKALQAQETADKTIIKAESASKEISLAQATIDQTYSQGKTVGIETAQNTLTTANDYYDEGLYLEAETAAKQAYQLALNSETPKRTNNTLIYIGALLFIITLISAYFIINKKQIIEKSSQVPRPKAAIIDVEKIFEKHETLRLEDKEVIKFLAENNGEVFATEIRERFDMPRSTTWRLIRRLKNLEIVEEIKIGNQSLVRIMEEYHA